MFICLKNYTKALLCFLFLFLSFKNYASHVSGGNITYQCVGPNQFEITLTLYRDCNGITAPNAPNINFTSTCGGNLNLALTQQSVNEVSQLCPNDIANSTCNGGTLPGVEGYIYTGIITLNPVCDTWTMSYSLCCRNNAIVNLANPAAENIYIEAKY